MQDLRSTYMYVMYMYKYYIRHPRLTIYANFFILNIFGIETDTTYRVFQDEQGQARGVWRGESVSAILGWCQVMRFRYNKILPD